MYILHKYISPFSRSSEEHYLLSCTNSHITDEVPKKNQLHTNILPVPSQNTNAAGEKCLLQ